MRTVTHEEIQASIDSVHNMTESQTRKFMLRMQKEQPYIQVYVAAICERGEFENENDADAVANLSSIVWRSMRRAAGGPLVKVKGHEIEKREEQIMQLYRYAEGEPESNWPNMVQAWMEGYNQRPLLEFVLDSLMPPENPYGVTEEGSGMIFTYVKVIIDCLDNAKPKRRI
ncbi:MAG: hypothetical protein ACOC6C_00880 [Verrucomicrobiota bacterium]